MKKSPSRIAPLMWCFAFLFAAFISGCGGSSRDPILGTGFTADTSVPTVTAVTPANAATGVAGNAKISATFSKDMDPATINATTFKLTGPGTTPVAGTVAYDAPTRTATFTPTSPATLATDTQFTATVTTGAKDLAARPLAADFVWRFTTILTPTTAPIVISTTPANAATGVAIDAKISATFSKDMDPTTINAATFKVAGPGTTAVAGTVTYDAANRVALFTPSTPATLASDTQFTATITTGAKALGGQALAADYVWTFTTVITPPRVVSTVPADRATNVAINTRISATFSKDMNPATLTAATFTLTGPGAAAVTGTVAYTAAARTATFTPTSPATLAPLTVYTATITTGAKDSGGTALAANYVWSFTTGAVASVTPPTVTSVSPASGTSGVCLQKVVNATFSQPMDPATITTSSFTLQVSGPPLGTVLPATVSYDAANQVASLTPTASLLPNTAYTATVTSAVRDLTGTALAANVVFTFTTGTASCTPPAAQPNLLGSAVTYGVFGGSAGMTNQGILTVVNGDIGTVATATSSITGFHDSAPSDIYTETGANKGNVTGKIFTCAVSTTGPTSAAVNPVSCTRATNALNDARAAYNALRALPAGSDPSTAGGNLGSKTLTPGTYTSAAGSFRIQDGDLTLDAQGDANAVFVFQMASTLTVGGPGAAFPQSIILKNGALAKNIYWQVGSAATINAGGGGSMAGTIISQQGVTFSTAGPRPTTTLNGRALSLNASVTLVDTVINVPAP